MMEPSQLSQLLAVMASMTLVTNIVTFAIARLTSAKDIGQIAGARDATIQGKLDLMAQELKGVSGQVSTLATDFKAAEISAMRVMLNNAHARIEALHGEVVKLREFKHSMANLSQIVSGLIEWKNKIESSMIEKAGK